MIVLQEIEFDKNRIGRNPPNTSTVDDSYLHSTDYRDRMYWWINSLYYKLQNNIHDEVSYSSIPSIKKTLI